MANYDCIPEGSGDTKKRIAKGKLDWKCPRLSGPKDLSSNKMKFCRPSSRLLTKKGTSSVFSGSFHLFMSCRISVCRRWRLLAIKSWHRITHLDFQGVFTSFKGVGGTTIRLSLIFLLFLTHQHVVFNSSVLCSLIAGALCFSGLTDEVLWSILRRGCQNITSLDLSQSPHFLTEFAVLCIGRCHDILLPQFSFTSGKQEFLCLAFFCMSSGFLLSA